MEVRPGYKQTEAGVIPEDWKVVTLGSVCNFENGDRSANYPSPSSFVDSGIPFINAGHLEDGRIVTAAMDHITPESYRRLGGGKVTSGDILFCLRGSLGKYGVVSKSFGKGAIASSLIIVRPKSTSLACEFLTCYFSSSLCRRMIDTWAGGAAQPNLGAQDLRRFLVAQPSTTSEQHAIAEALSDADALIKSLEQLLTKKRQIKEGAMQELLTGKRRLPGFSGEWEVKRLGDVCRITTGKKDVNEGNPQGQFPFFTCSRAHTFSDSYSFDTEAILIAGNGEVGNLHYFKGKFEAYQRTYVLSQFSGHVGYLWQQLSAYLADSLGLGKIGSSIPYIKMENLVGFEFSSPQYEAEQTVIAAVLSDIDAEIAALEAKLAKTRRLKQGMMQELLTGRIRLVRPSKSGDNPQC